MHTFTKRFGFALMMMSLFAVSLTAQKTNPQALTLEKATPTLQSRGPSTISNPVNQLVQVDELAISTFADSDDWTVATDTVSWEFLTTDSIDGRFTIPDVDLITSETFADGYAILNFSRGVDGNTDALPIVNELTSPIYDVSSLDDGVPYQISFYNQVRHCCNAAIAHTISFSYDGGATFSPAEVIGTIGANARVTETTFINLPPGVDTATQFQVRFTYSGGFYFWVIDDINISALAPINPVTNPFISIAANTATPATQASGYEMPFVADIQNDGGATIDVDLAITIFNAAGSTIYTDTTSYADVAFGELRENQVFDNTFPLPTEIGDYRGVYEVFTERIDEDTDMDNNTQEFAFSVTENVFSKGTFDGGSRPAGGVGLPYGFGNIYYTPSLAIPDSGAFLIDSVTFAMFVREFTDDDLAFLDLRTFGFRGDLNGDGNVTFGDANEPDAEMVELSVREFILDADFSEIPDGQAVTYAPSLSGPVAVPSTEGYVGFAVAVDYIPGSGGTNADNSTFTGTTDRGYAGFGLAASAAGVADSLSNYLQTSDGNTVYGFFADTAPFMDVFISYEGVSSVTELNAKEFAVRPNPATTQFAIDFDFGASVDAQFEIINAVGQTVSVFNRDGLTSGAITIPTQGMNNGLYYVKVRTNDGQTATRKLMLNR